MKFLLTFLKRFFYFHLIALILFHFVGCSDSNDLFENEIIDQSDIVGLKASNSNFSVFFRTDLQEQVEIRSSIEGGKLYTTLFFNDGNKGWIEYSDFNIDLSDEEYKSKMNLVVKEKADELLGKFNSHFVNSMENALEQLPALLYENLGIDKYYLETTQSIFLHLSVLKSIQRAENFKTEDCNCGTLDTYVFDESPFFCSEDKVAKADDILSFLHENLVREIGGEEFVPENTFKFLNERSGKYLALSKIDIMIKMEFDSFWNKLTTKQKNSTLRNLHSLDSEKSSITSRNSEYGFGCESLGVLFGTECGCCGNYSGFCSLCSIVCLWHDQDCSDCSPSWYCGWDCQTGC